MGLDERMGVYDVGDERDPRYPLANERTFLAWVRTTLALLAGSVALHSLGIPTTDWSRNALVVGLPPSVSLVVTVVGRRWPGRRPRVRGSRDLASLIRVVASRWVIRVV
jgi:hypothetical protein